jgi:multidrug efflux pump subunit AcrB
VYEKVLTTLVDNIEHIESTTISVNGLVVVKIFLQPTVSVDRAMAQVTAAPRKASYASCRPEHCLP